MTGILATAYYAVVMILLFLHDMKENLSDSTVLIIIILTLIVVISLVFSTRPQNADNPPSIIWRQPNAAESDSLRI